MFFIIDGATAMFLGGLYLLGWVIKICMKAIIFILTFMPKLIYYFAKYSAIIFYHCFKITMMILSFLLPLLDELGVFTFIKNLIIKVVNKIETKFDQLKNIKIENIKDFTQYKHTKHILLSTTLISPIIFFISAVNDCMAIGISSALMFMISLILLITYKCKNKRL